MEVTKAKCDMERHTWLEGETQRDSCMGNLFMVIKPSGDVLWDT